MLIRYLKILSLILDLLSCCFALGFAQGYLLPDEYQLLTQLFSIHLNYFLSPLTITSSGLPCTAYKVGDLARYGYSNPTEWGYALQAWIAAAERGLISHEEAIARLLNAVTTLQTLQQDPEKNFEGFFYPFYKVRDSEGNDLPTPFPDFSNPNNYKVPSGDNALLYASLLITEGYARAKGASTLREKAHAIRSNMNFRIFLVQQDDELFLAHTKHAQTGELSQARWDVYADEGGVVTWIACLSDSVTFTEYQLLTESQKCWAASWISCTDTSYTVQEPAWFNAMFPWGVRSLAGFPISDYDAPGGARSLYAPASLVPNAEAHLTYGDCLGFDHPGFSDAMSQAEGDKGLVGWQQGWYIPPNLPGIEGNIPGHIMPHAFFVPFNAGPDLGIPLKTRLIQEIRELIDDRAGYYHDNNDILCPFGFEVIASPYKDDLSYNGANDGRYVFETLSHAYISLSLFNALQLNDERPTFYTIATFVPEYSDKVRKVLQYLYPSSLSVQDIDPYWSPAGNKLVFVSNRDGNWEIYVAERVPGGFDFDNATRLTYNNADDLSPAWSPDGNAIAFVSNRDGTYRVYVMSPNGADQTPITEDLCPCATCWPTSVQPNWSPDVAWIVFASQEMNGYCRYNVYRVRPDGRDLYRLSSDPWGSSHDIEPAWSPLGNKIAFSTNRTGKYRLAWMNPDTGQGPGSGNAITDEPPCTPGYEWRYGRPAWSPDGEYIAFEDLCSGSIHIIRPDGTGDTVIAQGHNPSWSPDGRYLAYDTDGEIRLLPLSTTAVFRIERDSGNVLSDGCFYGAEFVSGPADIAEWVPVSEPVEPGDVLEIDPENPGHYRKARGPCSQLVAGVVSTKPGFVLGHGEDTEGKVLLALMGIVPVKVTDEGGPIRPGDLLVVSSIPGYAMRWNHEGGEPCGLVGKALEAFEGNKGVILILVLGT